MYFMEYLSVTTFKETSSAVHGPNKLEKVEKEEFSLDPLQHLNQFHV
jgi:hypothetical protein